LERVHIFCTRFNEKLPDEVFNRYLQFLPSELQEKNEKFYRWQDRTSNLLGKVLLLEGLKSLHLNSSLDELKVNGYNKPYLSDFFDFSISHSGEIVLCALTIGQKVGIDVEEIKEIDFEDFKRFFSTQQFDQIVGAYDPFSEFYKLWTIKESVVKADGRGLSLPLLSILIDGNLASVGSQKWFLHNLPIAVDYKATLAYERESTSYFEYHFDATKILLT
jgi:4'-phosphopantetheinyl transferase